MTEKQIQLDNRYMRMARIWAENSYCERRKVGALLVKNKMIISACFPRAFPPIPSFCFGLQIAMEF